MKKLTLSIAMMLFTTTIYTAEAQPLVIEKQGSFAAGGTVITAPGTFDPVKPKTDGQTLHADHAYVFYQIPQRARRLPLVFWHGFGQTTRTWETTPDGREGFQTIFLRRRFPVYLIDQPRRGHGGRSSQPVTISPVPDEQYWLGMFRITKGSEYFPGVQFSKAPEALNQFLRQITPDTGPIDMEANTNAVSELFSKIGAGILVTHSHSGGQGWLTAIKNKNIKGIVSFEPGSGFVFPKGEVPDAMSGLTGRLEAVAIPKEDFLKLTSFPIIIYYGDFIPDTPSDFYGTDNWRTRLAMAKLFCNAINRLGGDATLVHLPEAGIKGNTHFLMSDLNNVEIAYLMSKWLKEKGLDR